MAPKWFRGHEQIIRERGRQISRLPDGVKSPELAEFPGLGFLPI